MSDSVNTFIGGEMILIRDDATGHLAAVEVRAGSQSVCLHLQAEHEVLDLWAAPHSRHIHYLPPDWPQSGLTFGFEVIS